MLSKSHLSPPGSTLSRYCDRYHNRSRCSPHNLIPALKRHPAILTIHLNDYIVDGFFFPSGWTILSSARYLSLDLSMACPVAVATVAAHDPLHAIGVSSLDLRPL